MKNISPRFIVGETRKRRFPVGKTPMGSDLVRFETGADAVTFEILHGPAWVRGACHHGIIPKVVLSQPAADL